MLSQLLHLDHRIFLIAKHWKNWLNLFLPSSHISESWYVDRKFINHLNHLCPTRYEQNHYHRSYGWVTVWTHLESISAYDIFNLERKGWAAVRECLPIDALHFGFWEGGGWKLTKSKGLPLNWGPPVLIASGPWLATAFKVIQLVSTLRCEYACNLSKYECSYSFSQRFSTPILVGCRYRRECYC